jgi:hypothetical protein
MATITTRSGKGSPLTNTEVDNNFTNLNNDKLETAGGTLTGNLTISTGGTPQLSLYDSGNGGGGGASHRIEFTNTNGASTAILIDGATSGHSDLIITNNNASGHVDNDGITDITSDIVLWPLSHVRIESGHLQIGSTTVIDASRNISGVNFDVSDTINLNNSDAYGILFGENAQGMAYSAREGNAWAQRYFFMIDSTNDDSYPFLTNRTAGGRVSIFSGNSAGGGEVERLVFWGGDGVRDAKFTNANIDLNNNDIKNIDTALFNNGQGLVSDAGASFKTGSGGGTWFAKAASPTSTGLAVLNSVDETVAEFGISGSKVSEFHGNISTTGTLTASTKVVTPSLRLGALNSSDVSTGSIDVSIVERATGNGRPEDESADVVTDLPLAEWFDPFIDLPAGETYATATNSWTFTAGTASGTRWYAKLKLHDAQDGPNDPKLGVNGTEYDLGYERTPNGSATDDSNQWHVYDITDAVVTGTNTVKVWLSGQKTYLIALYVFPSTGVMLPNEPYELPMYSDQGVGIKDTLVIDGSRNITAATLKSEGALYANSTDEVFHTGNIGTIDSRVLIDAPATAATQAGLTIKNSDFNGGIRDWVVIENAFDRDIGLQLKHPNQHWQMWIDGGTGDTQNLVFSGTDGTDVLELTQAGNVTTGGQLSSNTLSVTDAASVGGTLTVNYINAGGGGVSSSYFQDNSTGLNTKAISTDWLYTSFIEAPTERGSGGTGIAISDLNGFTNKDEVGLITNGSVGFKLDSNSNSTATGNLSVSSAGSLYVHYNSSNSYRSSFDWNLLQFGNNGANRIVAGRTTAGGYFQFWVSNTADVENGGTPNGTEAMRLDNSGHLIVPEGITLGTAAASTYTAANTLDDYEEGTFTVTSERAGYVEDTGGFTGRYVKVGALVHVTISTTNYVRHAPCPYASGQSFVITSNLPFTPATTGGSQVAHTRTLGNSDILALTWRSGSSAIYLNKVGDNNAYEVSNNVTTNSSQTNISLIWSGSYFTNS